MTTANAMTIELVKILEAAQYHYEKEYRFFGYALDEADNKEVHELWLTECDRQDMMCRGILEAYEILTGEKIYPHQIKETLHKLA